MSNLQLRKEVSDGVEFFVSNDGEQVGMSQQGLATLTGVSGRTLHHLFTAYNNLHKLPTKALEAIRDKGLKTYTVPAVDVEEGRGRDTIFIPAELCAAIIKYYAFESKSITVAVKEKSECAFDQFAAIGIKTWILQVTGFKSSSGQDIAPMLQTILSQMQEVRDLSQRYVNLKEMTKTQPGLEDILDTYEQGYLLTDGQQFTLQTWLKAKGLVLSHSALTRLGTMVGRVYEAHHRRPAPRDMGKKYGNKGWGYVKVYTTEDLPLLESALKTCTSH